MPPKRSADEVSVSYDEYADLDMAGSPVARKGSKAKVQKKAFVKPAEKVTPKEKKAAKASAVVNTTPHTKKVGVVSSSSGGKRNSVNYDVGDSVVISDRAAQHKELVGKVRVPPATSNVFCVLALSRTVTRQRTSARIPVLSALV